MGSIARPAYSRTIALWVLRVLVGGMFILSGIMNLTGQPMMVDTFDKVGLGQWLRIVTGLLEVAGGAAVLIPSLSVLGQPSSWPWMPAPSPRRSPCCTRTGSIAWSSARSCSPSSRCSATTGLRSSGGGPAWPDGRSPEGSDADMTGAGHARPRFSFKGTRRTISQARPLIAGPAHSAPSKGGGRFCCETGGRPVRLQQYLPLSVFGSTRWEPTPGRQARRFAPVKPSEGLCVQFGDGRAERIKHTAG